MKDKELKPKQEVPLVYFTGKIMDPSICIFVFSYFNCQQRGIVGTIFGKCLTRGASSSRVWDSNRAYGCLLLFLFNEWSPYLCWDGLIAGISGRPVPRLPKDVTGPCYLWSGIDWRIGHCL